MNFYNRFTTKEYVKTDLLLWKIKTQNDLFVYYSRNTKYVGI